MALPALEWMLIRIPPPELNCGSGKSDTPCDRMHFENASAAASASLTFDRSMALREPVAARRERELAQRIDDRLGHDVAVEEGNGFGAHGEGE